MSSVKREPREGGPRQLPPDPRVTPINKAREIEPPPPIFTYTLTEPLQAYGQTITELVFRRPTALDIFTCGNPVRLDLASSPPKVDFEVAAMFAMMSTLANVPLSTIKTMDPNDWNSVAWGLAPFFMPRPGTI